MQNLEDFLNFNKYKLIKFLFFKGSKGGIRAFRFTRIELESSPQVNQYYFQD